MEERIKKLKLKYFHVYIKICGYLDILPVGRGLCNFYPLTCTMCPRFQNRFIISINMTKFRGCNYSVRGFCSKECYDKFKKSKIKEWENYYKLQKWNSKCLVGFLDNFGDFASKKIISIPEKMEMPIIKFLWRGKGCVKTISGREVYFMDNLVKKFNMVYDYKLDPLDI